jgi:hypothetical protein
MIRLHRKTFSDYFLSWFGLFPFICDHCDRRALRLRPSRAVTGAALSLAAVCCLMLAVASVCGVIRRAQHASHLRDVAREAGPVGPAAPGVLTNRDVVQLVRGRLSDSALVALMKRMNHNFAVDSKSLADLKRAGVSEGVILSMVELSLPAKLHAPASTNAAAVTDREILNDSNLPGAP